MLAMNTSCRQGCKPDALLLNYCESGPEYGSFFADLRERLSVRVEGTTGASMRTLAASGGAAQLVIIGQQVI
jgi:hypothetical protein